MSYILPPSLFVLVLAAMPFACDSSGAGPGDRIVDRGGGKADITGSCGTTDANSCGDQSQDGCFCDPACESYGDCCADYSPVCLGEKPDPDPDPDPTGFPSVLYVEMGAMEHQGDDSVSVPAPCPAGRLCTFTIQLTIPYEIFKAVQGLRDRGHWYIATGNVVPESAGYNVNELGELWGWHLENAGLSIAAPELCDTGPDLLQAAIDNGTWGTGAVGDGACFWAFMPIRAFLADGTPINTTPQGRADCGDYLVSECPDGCELGYEDPEGSYLCNDFFPGPTPCPLPGAYPLECMTPLESL